MIDNKKENLIQMFRSLEPIQFSPHQFQKQRGYLLAQEIRQSQGQTEIIGFWKGSPISINQMVYITGYGGYSLSEIQILGGLGIQVSNPNSQVKWEEIEGG